MDLLSLAAGILTLAFFYAALTLVLNLEAGFGGLWDLGTAGLVAVGAYTYVLVTDLSEEGIGLGWPLWAGVLSGGVATAVVAHVISRLSTRARGEYFLIVTLAFAEVIHQLTINLRDLTRGTRGFSQLPRPFEGLVDPSNYHWVLFTLSLVFLAATYFVMSRLAASPWGQALRSIRDNESVALSLGIDGVGIRRRLFTISGAMIGLLAPLYVWHVRSITPSLFTSDLTFLIWTALVIGGIGSLRGPVVGALGLVVATEALTLIQGSASLAVTLSYMQPVLLGVLLVLAMRLRPEGLITERGELGAAARRLAARHSALSPIPGGADD